jgi:hypothetical protein
MSVVKEKKGQGVDNFGPKRDKTRVTIIADIKKERLVNESIRFLGVDGRIIKVRTSADVERFLNVKKRVCYNMNITTRSRD